MSQQLTRTWKTVAMMTQLNLSLQCQTITPGGTPTSYILWGLGRTLRNISSTEECGTALKHTAQRQHGFSILRGLQEELARQSHSWPSVANIMTARGSLISVTPRSPFHLKYSMVLWHWSDCVSMYGETFIQVHFREAKCQGRGGEKTEELSSLQA